VWILDPAVGSDTPAADPAPTNHHAQDAWQRYERFLANSSHSTRIALGPIANAPVPTIIRPDPYRIEALKDPQTGAHLQLCTDEAALQSAQLPSYAASSHRYLICDSEDGITTFYPVSSGAPSNDNTRSIDSVLNAESGAYPLNPGAGRILVTRFHPISLESLLKVLEGDTWAGVLNGRTVLPVGDEFRKLSQSATAGAGGHMLLARSGTASRLSEVLHLKLRALADAVGDVHSLTAVGEAPLLNLSLDSFRIDLPAPAPGLPYLWAMRAILAAPGDAIGLDIPAADHASFLSPSSGVASVFRAQSGRQSARGRASVRIRQLIDQGPTGIVLDGTLSTPERIEQATNDLLWMRLPVGDQIVDMFSTLLDEEALAAGERHFRSLSLRLDAALVQQMKALEGVPLSDIRFESVPLRTSPADLYSLVIAVRTFFTDQQQSLAQALDEVLRLARTVDELADGDATLLERIRQVLKADERWLESLGPHRLISKTMTPAEALGGIPMSLWVQVIELIMKMFPGALRESFCVDQGDAPMGGLASIYEPVEQSIEGLLVCSRSLIVVDWHANREIHSLIRAHSTGLSRV